MGLGGSKQPAKLATSPNDNNLPPGVDPLNAASGGTSPGSIPHKPTPPAEIRHPASRHHRTPSQPIAVPISPDADRGISIAVSPSNGFVPTGAERIPTVFTWTHGGKQVAVTGTWSGWKEVFPLKQSHNDFTAILELPPGVHQYKFIVDGKWTHAPEQPVATDTDGNLNNYMDVKEFRLETKPIIEKSTPPGSYSQEVPALFLAAQDGPLDNPFLRTAVATPSGPYSSTPIGTSPSPYTYSHTPTPQHIHYHPSPSTASPAVPTTVKPSTSAPSAGFATPAARERSRRETGPPALPPHLLRSRAVLNTETEDPSVLPLPNHVMLNHLYLREDDGNDDMKDVMILGTTVRYRDKFVTTVFYRPQPRAEKREEEKEEERQSEVAGELILSGDLDEELDFKKEPVDNNNNNKEKEKEKEDGEKKDKGGGGDQKEQVEGGEAQSEESRERSKSEGANGATSATSGAGGRGRSDTGGTSDGGGGGASVGASGVGASGGGGAGGTTPKRGSWLFGRKGDGVKRELF